MMGAEAQPEREPSGDARTTGAGTSAPEPALNDDVLSLRPKGSSAYRHDYPRRADYMLGLIVKPCEGGRHDCCRNHYGAPTHVVRKARGGAVLEQEVTEWGEAVEYRASRRPDPSILHDPTCRGAGDPDPECVAPVARKVPSRARPPCADNAEAVDAMASCKDVDGTVHRSCMQIGYSSTAFIPMCGGAAAEDPHCGTFIEVHVPGGTPYHPEEFVVSEVRIGRRDVSGYDTLTIPLSFPNGTAGQSRVACRFRETRPAPGGRFRVKGSAPKCCCPPKFRAARGTGSYFCPRDRSRGAEVAGPWLGAERSLAYLLRQGESHAKMPFCPPLPGETGSAMPSVDKIFCGVEAAFPGGQALTYGRECRRVTSATGAAFTSPDLNGTYAGACPYWDACAAAGEAGSCQGADALYDFEERVGKVTEVLDDARQEVMLSFNGGRSSYRFLGKDIEVVPLDYNYELWWVERTPSESIVRKKKPFNVIAPECTFDPSLGRHFPFAELSPDTGLPIK